MKKITVLFLLVALLLGGCSWLDGEYHSVKPHAMEGEKPSKDVVSVSSYVELRDALVDMTTSGRLQSTFYINNFDLELVDQYMNTAIMHLLQNSAISAYAVDTIDYEVGNSAGLLAIAVDVSYIHGRQEILRIKNVTNMEGVKALISYSLNNCEASTVIKVSEYEELDVEQFVREYADANPHLCMEIPQVAAITYPEKGKERVLEIIYTYQTSRDTLKVMKEMVSPIFSAAELYVQSSEGESQKYEQLYSFLMERFDYKYETSNTPAYSLLRYGVGDSKAFAMVYSIMCQNADLQCEVVSGTRNGEAHYWNLIRCEDVDYHVDLLASNELGEFTMMIADEMTGYVWDYSEYQ